MGKNVLRIPVFQLSVDPQISTEDKATDHRCAMQFDDAS